MHAPPFSLPLHTAQALREKTGLEAQCSELCVSAVREQWQETVSSCRLTLMEDWGPAMEVTKPRLWGYTLSSLGHHSLVS